MESVLVGAVTLVAGALIGYWVRLAEFRRETRLRVYGEFVGAFLGVAHLGAALFALYTSLRDKMYTAVDYRPLVDDFREAVRDFETGTAKLRLIAGANVRRKSEELEDFLKDNVRRVPPFRKSESMDWGNAASRSPAAVATEANVMAREFADCAAPEVSRLFRGLR